MIYLASPYSHPDSAVMDSRHNEACKACAIMMNAGLVVYSPIAHCHFIAVRYGLPRVWSFWKRFDTEMISKADEVLVLQLEGWQDSEGIKAEVAIAEELGITVRYTTPGEVAALAAERLPKRTQPIPYNPTPSATIYPR